MVKLLTIQQQYQWQKMEQYMQDYLIVQINIEEHTSKSRQHR